MAEPVNGITTHRKKEITVILVIQEKIQNVLVAIQVEKVVMVVLGATKEILDPEEKEKVNGDMLVIRAA
jgi:hypothetical protein